MDIKFRDVSSGIVDSRAIIQVAPGVYLNEVTILRKSGTISVELPQKSFKGRDNKLHHLDIISFDNDDHKTLWLMEIKEEYMNWRKQNKKVLVFEGE